MYTRFSHHIVLFKVILCDYLKAKAKIDIPEKFLMALNNSELCGDRRCELISTLRVALTSNPVS